MNEFELIAEARTDVGKGASRRLRRDGKLPGIVYGTGKEASMITLQHNAVMHNLEHEAFYSHILSLKIGSETESVVLKDLQRHPYKRSLLHIDLLRVDANETLTMRVPLHYINEEKCAGVKNEGGVISHLMTDIDIVCLPKDLPEYIEVDMLEVNLNDTLHLSDLKLPEGVDIHSLLHGGDAAQPVASVHAPKVVAEEEDSVAVEGEEGDVAAAADEEGSKDSES
ncbi:MAG: 50S ribosomal protein L25 [marine bacterium B5-7]|nr:MAG: 50S ribosomal protein L25 [marine bacterium B5-7]